MQGGKLPFQLGADALSNGSVEGRSNAETGKDQKYGSKGITLFL